ncbi:MAG TPA: transcriptional regulator, partial [Rectinemataceae bacterium]|nr:transcriptional regulator [Rectinemataceae bacterium]
AEVTSLNAELSLRPGMTLDELKRELLAYEKRRFYERTEFGALTGNQHLDFSSPGRYDVVLEHILVHKYYVNQSMTGELSFRDALFSWHENVYRPIVLAIEEEGLLARFPGRTTSDLYVFIVQHWDELKRKYGLAFPLSEAARDYSKRFGRGPGSRIRDRVHAVGGSMRALVKEILGRQ